MRKPVEGVREFTCDGCKGAGPIFLWSRDIQSPSESTCSNCDSVLIERGAYVCSDKLTQAQATIERQAKAIAELRAQRNMIINVKFESHKAREFSKNGMDAEIEAILNGESNDR